jgi:hypothetical protein
MTNKKMRDEKGQIQGKFITVINMFIKLIWLIQGDCIIWTENAEQESTRKRE